MYFLGPYAIINLSVAINSYILLTVLQAFNVNVE